MHCFLASLEDGHLSLLEHEAMKWLTKEELDSVSWLPADVEVVQKLRTILA